MCVRACVRACVYGVCVEEKAFACGEHRTCVFVEQSLCLWRTKSCVCGNREPVCLWNREPAQFGYVFPIAKTISIFLGGKGAGLDEHVAQGSKNNDLESIFENSDLISK